MKHHPFDKTLPDRVLSRFFQIKRAEGERFWTGSEIQKFFQVSRYAATEVIENLKKRGIVSSLRGSGTRLLQVKPFEVTPFLEPRPLHHSLTVIRPEWWSKEQSLLKAIESKIQKQAEQKNWKIEFIESELFVKKSCYEKRLNGDYRALLFIDPRPTLSIPMTHFKEKGFPMIIIGGPDTVSDQLEIPVVLVEEKESSRLLVLQCLSRGYRRFCVVGNAHPSQGMIRHQGFEAAMQEYCHSYPMDWYIPHWGDQYTQESLHARLQKNDFPEVIIFQEYPTFLKLYKNSAPLRKSLQSKTIAVVYDDGLGPLEDQIVRVRFDIDLLMKNVLEAIRLLFQGKRIPTRIYHTLKSEWPQTKKLPLKPIPHAEIKIV